LDPQVLHLQIDNIASVGWAKHYPGCKLFIELKPGTLTTSRMLTKGDKVIFDGYNPGFQYEFSRILHMTEKETFHVELLAYNHDKEFCSEASNVFFPCVLEVPGCFIESRNFYFPGNSS